ncbi:CPBP family intramembrane glutamic endopeptidase [Ruminococcus flavefaciens]|uniref:CPBP family intramembrane glutamic endopeptidase n=1 Tax=Ruminococcus flavefaciens TaxID=1265 RepID=UPI000466C803|nr:type II CAAX endopeptidase family protein [Ruminococcus flavefaciens]
MIKLIRNISPFNNRTDMPAAMLVIKKLLAFILCFAAGTLLGNAVVIGAMIVGGKKFLQGETFTESTMELLGLYAMAGMIAASVLYWKIIEKRNLSEMGVTGRIGGLFVGALIGTVLLFVCVAAIMLTGSIRFKGISKEPDLTMILLMLGGFVIQGAAEEFLCRGLVLCSLKDRVPLPIAVGASTLAFIYPHWSTLRGFKPQYIFSGVLGLIVISCVFSFITLRTKSIWAACGLHSVWNFCLSCVLGLDLSGSEGASTALIDMRSVGENLLNGGKYGIEASIISDIIIAVLAAVTGYMVIKTRKRRAENGVQ